MTCPSRLFPAAVALLLLISWLSPALALETHDLVSPPPMEPGYPHYGAISGQIICVKQGLPGAYVAIVNAANPSQAFFEGLTDDGGYYQFQSVNNTMAGGSPQLSYRVYASLSGTGECLSYPFGVEEKTTTNVIVAITNGGRIGSGFEVQHIPMPDDIKLTALPDTLMAGGNVSVITAQLYLNGQPYQRSGVVIKFFTDNETIGYLPAEKRIATDASGRSVINLTSGNTSGQVNVTGYSIIGISRNITGSCSAYIESAACWQGPIVDINDTQATNATELSNGSYENATTGVTPGNVVYTNVSATPGPTASVGSQDLYPALLIILVVVAGFTVYMLAFRKK